MIVTHKKGNRACDLFLVGKKIWNRANLKYEITFLDSCLYPPLPLSPITGLDENSSDNKLIYIGDLNPHHKAANFGWRHYQGNLEICARYYDNDSGEHDNHIVLWRQTVKTGLKYVLEHRNESGRHVWYFNDRPVAYYHEPMPTGWLSSPWFGGGAGLCFKGNVPQQNIQFNINIL